MYGEHIGMLFVEEAMYLPLAFGTSYLCEAQNHGVAQKVEEEPQCPDD